MLHHHRPVNDAIRSAPSAGVGLTHRRLLMIALSSAGHQPMLSSNARYALSYDVKSHSDAAFGAEKRARPREFAATSDPELLPATISQWSIDDALERGNGVSAPSLRGR